MTLHWRIAIASLMAGLLACSTTARVKAETALAEALISDQDETKLGLQVQDELKKQNVTYMDDPQINAYVEQVSGKLFPFAEKDRPGVKWQVKVIDDPKTVNAFATPGGFLYVYSGLLMAADNEAEVAGVMGHETGHVVARHSARQMVDAYGLQAVTSMALGEKPNLVAQVASALVGQGALLAHSRSEESEADEYGARYASAAGYDPHGLVTFFEKLQKQEGHTPQILTWLSTHPATADRIAKINQYIAQNNLTGSDLGADRLAPIKAKLKARPPPPEKPQTAPAATQPAPGASSSVR